MCRTYIIIYYYYNLVYIYHIYHMSSYHFEQTLFYDATLMRTFTGFTIFASVIISSKQKIKSTPTNLNYLFIQPTIWVRIGWVNVVCN